jgi:hypothetical protein
MTTRSPAPAFFVGQTYENRQGRFTVLAIRGNALDVRFQDGTTARLDAEIQSRIIDNLSRERAVAAEALRRTRAQASILRLPAPKPAPQAPQPAQRRLGTTAEEREQRRRERLDRLDQFMMSEGWPKEVRRRVLGLVETGHLRLITGPFGGFGMVLGAEAAGSPDIVAAQREWLFDAWRGNPPPLMRALLDLAPMPPGAGPPLPRRLDRRWPRPGGARLRFG